MNKRLLLSVFAVSVIGAAATGDPGFTPQRYLAHIRYLASPEMRGRETGSPELEHAAEYIAAQFEASGLKPVDGKRFVQPFPVTGSAKLGTKNDFEFVLSGRTRKLEFRRDFIPYNFSSSGKASGDIVFAGYGITAPEYNYDDYANLNVKDKLVLVLAHEPQEYNEKSVFEGKVYTDHAQLYSKAANARRHGARGLLVVTDNFNHEIEQEKQAQTDELEKFGRTTGPADAGIIAIQVKEAFVEPWFKAAKKDLYQIEKQIDADLKPRSFELKNVTIRENVDVEREVKTVNNVLGYIAGETDEYVVIGAHYDHLGLGEQYSLAPSLAGKEIHPGADDNASGTAGVIELAKYFAGQPKAKRGMLFMTFAGEEQGLLGSGYYANHPILPIEKAVAMINLDMIGRVKDKKLYIGGLATGAGFREQMEKIASKHELKLDYSDNSGYGSSDHTSFTAKQVPVLFFFSGLHGDYHKPGDTWDKIDAKDAVEVLKIVADMGTLLETETERPKFVKVEPDPKISGVTSSGSSSSGGYGPYFGSIPDFAEPPAGVRFADVREGSPAAVAGLKAGDIMVGFGGKEIRNLYDFTYALRERKVGDEVTVQVLRGDQKVSVQVKLTERK